MPLRWGCIAGEGEGGVLRTDSHPSPKPLISLATSFGSNLNARNSEIWRDSPKERDPGSTLTFEVTVQFTPMTCAERFVPKPFEVELSAAPPSLSLSCW